MEEEIVNRVAKSPLVTIDLEDYYLEGNRITVDLSQWLFEGLLLREKEFRKAIEDWDITPLEDSFVALYCSTDAIIPGWAYMLVSAKLQPSTKKVIVGSLEDLETVLYAEIIQNIEVSEYTAKPIIIKGCSNKPVPQSAYVLMTQKLLPVAKSVMYGEACSSVPIYKQSKK